MRFLLQKQLPFSAPEWQHASGMCCALAMSTGAKTRNAERRVEEKKNEWVAEAAVTQRFCTFIKRLGLLPQWIMAHPDSHTQARTESLLLTLGGCNFLPWAHSARLQTPIGLSAWLTLAAQRSVMSHSQQAYNFHSVERRRVLCHYSHLFCPC